MTEQDDFGFTSGPKKERRSGIDRRWIKAGYQGQERRSGINRREDTALRNPLLPLAPSPIDAEGLEKLLVSATLQLEAITRLLLQNGLIDPEEFEQVLSDMRDEYQSQTKD